MNRFWEILMKPCLESIEAKNIVEIGSDNGYGTKNLIKYCKKVKGRVISIDPFPKYDYKEWENNHKNVFKLYTDLSLNRLPLLKDYDAILVDGDHNWYTVYNELKIIEKTFEGKQLPLIFLHDIDWPYARRDLYYNPDNIPVVYRQAYAKKGILPNELNLVDEGGLNDHLDNSIYENNPHNGVRTAIEDFINEYKDKERLGFIGIPGFFGLGIIYDKEKHKDILDVVNNEISNNDVVKRVELERIDFIIKNTSLIRKNKKIINLNNDLENKNEHLKNSNESLKDKNEYLENSNEILKNEQIKLKREVNDLRYKESELENKINNIETKECILLDENAKLKQSLKEKDKRINNLIVENKVHLNSVRYNLGDVIIRGIKPSIDTIKMPVRIMRLFKQGLQKKKKRDNLSNQSIEQDFAKKITPILESSVQQKDILRRDKVHLENDQKYILNLSAKYDKIYKFESNPLVSIIMVNHNGEEHLHTFFKSIIKNVTYKNIEIIVVDNSSKDKSLAIIDSYSNELDIKVIKNSNNESYSKANNQGAEIAKGQYYLFANNDIEVFKGWLEELLLFSMDNKEIGAVGSLLFYPQCPKNSINKGKSFTIQHCGIKFKKTEERIIPYNYLNEKSPNEALKEITTIGALTGASLMIEGNKFDQVGGFTQEYIYGYEDVDLSLKLLKKGYLNYIVPSSMAYHFEFGTQNKQISSDVSIRRKNNIKVFKSRWEKWLEKQNSLSIFEKDDRFFDKKVKVAFAVTEAGKNVSAGDYFTAMEFGEAMKKRGWEVEFLKRKGPEDWYEVNEDIDIVIALLDAYDVRKIKCENKNLITIAWARNWFERWANHPYINDYTYIAASSEIACDYMEKIIGKKIYLLKIASNKERFTLSKVFKKELECDYCFTGSYWNDPREIINMLNPQKYPEYKFNIYGANWDKIDKFKKFNKGFVSYETMPDIYASTKIVIDDANRVTKPFGSVNSRVFDALASGVLIITNGLLGAEYTFNNLLPTYTNEQELHNLITYYLTHEKERTELVNKLQNQVLKHHTYDNRVDELLNLIGYIKPKKNIIIKTPVPNEEIAQEWGDYHFALALVREFEKLDYEAEFQYLNQWNNDDSYADIIMVLRGLNKYEPKNYHYNIMWNISHPDKINVDEYYFYDQTYIASEIWTKHVKKNAKNNYTKVDVLLQCADPSVFKPIENESTKYELLFVGNSRKIYRKIIKDILPSKYELSVYGANWEEIIPKQYIKGNNIPNIELYKHYSGAKILLNDHWDDMREKGFISNRIFDALSCKSFIITDKVAGLEKYFGDAVVTYKDKKDLQEKVELYMNNEELRNKEIEKGYEIVIKNHTFEKRAKQIINDINNK